MRYGSGVSGEPLSRDVVQGLRRVSGFSWATAAAVSAAPRPIVTIRQASRTSEDMERMLPGAGGGRSGNECDERPLRLQAWAANARPVRRETGVCQCSPLRHLCDYPQRPGTQVPQFGSPLTTLRVVKMDGSLI